MTRLPLRTGLAAGILASTATAGALIAIGSRVSTPARPFNIIAGHLLGAARTDMIFGFVASVTIVGVVVHVVLTTFAGVIATYISTRRLAPAWAAALIVTLGAALVSVGLARRGDASLARLLTVGDLLLFYIVLAVALTAGIRLASTGLTTESDRHVDVM